MTAPLLAALAAICAVLALRTAVERRRRARVVAGPRPRSASALERALRARLRRAGIGVGPGAALAGTAAASAMAAGLTWQALASPVISLLAAVAVPAGAAQVLRSADDRYRRRVAGQLPGAAADMAAALAAGLSLVAALDRAALDAPEPIRGELARCAAEIAAGARVEEALDRLAARVPDPAVRVLVLTIAVQRGAGGNLAAGLRRLVGRLEGRGRLAREVRAATAQARMTAWLVAAMPGVGAVVVELAAPGTLARTLGQGVGMGLLLVALAAQAIGVAIIMRLSRPA